MGELNQHDLKDYIERYNLTTFVETGTGKAVGLSYALQFDFQKLFSIEINEQLYTENVNKIKDPRCQLLWNNSLDGLAIILQQLEMPTLFWLDAHFPGADFGLGSYDADIPRTLKLPLEYELELIVKNRNCAKDVFIIDDLRLLEKGEYELGDLSEREKYGYCGVEFIIKLFGDTHQLKRDLRHQGFLILVPK